jgi:hypothetical protein
LERSQSLTEVAALLNGGKKYEAVALSCCFTVAKRGFCLAEKYSFGGWLARVCVICSNNVFLFDLESARKLRPFPGIVHLCCASFSLPSSSSAHEPVRLVVPSMLGSKETFHLFKHCFLVRTGTCTEIVAQSLSPYVCTASFSLLSSTAGHLLLHLLAVLILVSKESCHLILH